MGPHYSIHMASFCMLHQDKRKEDRWKSRTGRVERSVSHASKRSPSKAVSLQLACFLTSDVSSLCGELNQNNLGHLVCRTRIPREKGRGRGRKERSISGKHWITTKISLRLLCILPYLVKQRACCEVLWSVDGKVVFGDLARSGDPMEYRRTKGWPPWCRRRLAVTHWIYKWSVDL